MKNQKTGQIVVSQLTRTCQFSATSCRIRHPIVHISTDYVFDGQKDGVYTETDLFNPISVYGRSKAAGDYAVMNYAKHYIIRTSWVIGQGHNFINIMKSLAEKGVSPSVVDDQFGRLTFTEDIADGVKFLLETRDCSEPTTLQTTVMLLTGTKSLNWYLKNQDDIKMTFRRIPTEEYFQGKDFIAPRPKNSQLNLTKIKSLGFKPADWHDKLDQYLN